MKGALDHIQSELAKYTGGDANDQKNTFKKVMKGSFESNNNNLDQFKEQITSTYRIAGS
ncbi:Mlp family lipoprotein [Borrelia parkeri]|uniref:Mlp family lipoprotein n=1 Tax=Borrelia parkeri TaxID=141 RepID=UPI001FF5DDCA|nr:Mlp family lipoprotein [Borrelia parkeri]